jgi:hypothetical protein
MIIEICCFKHPTVVPMHKLSLVPIAWTHFYSLVDQLGSADACIVVCIGICYCKQIWAFYLGKRPR